MVRDNDYIDFLKLIVSCINKVDYFSEKELSNLELEKMQPKINNENENKYTKNSKTKFTN